MILTGEKIKKFKDDFMIAYGVPPAEWFKLFMEETSDWKDAQFHLCIVHLEKEDCPFEIKRAITIVSRALVLWREGLISEALDAIHDAKKRLEFFGDGAFEATLWGLFVWRCYLACSELTE